jgi:hypothetical protein
MSYQNYDQYQNQGAPDGAAGPGAPAPQDGQMSGQMGGQPTEQSQPPFPGTASGDATPGVGPGGDQKTTLW